MGVVSKCDFIMRDWWCCTKRVEKSPGHAIDAHSIADMKFHASPSGGLPEALKARSTGHVYHRGAHHGQSRRASRGRVLEGSARSARSAISSRQTVLELGTFASSDDAHNIADMKCRVSPVVNVPTIFSSSGSSHDLDLQRQGMILESSSFAWSHTAGRSWLPRLV